MAINGVYRIRFRSAGWGRKRCLSDNVFGFVSTESRKPIKRELPRLTTEPARSAPWNGIGLVGLFVVIPLLATPLAVLLIPAFVFFFVLSYV